MIKSRRPASTAAAMRSGGFNYSQDQVQELIRCKDDPLYFIETYVRLPSGAKLKLNEQQREALSSAQEFKNTVVRTRRATGLSTLMLAYSLWFSMFNHENTVMFFTMTTQSAADSARALLSMHESLPSWLRAELSRSTRDSVEFQNFTRILFSSYQNRHCTCGLTLDLVLWSDASFYRDLEFSEMIQSVVPAVRADGQQIMWSADGYSEMFKQLWEIRMPNTGYVDLRA